MFLNIDDNFKNINDEKILKIKNNKLIKWRQIMFLNLMSK